MLIIQKSSDFLQCLQNLIVHLWSPHYAPGGSYAATSLQMSSSHCTLGTQSSNLAEICSFVIKLMKKWIRLACLPTWWLRPAQRCRRRPHTQPAPPQSCRRGQVKTQSGGAGCLLFMWRVSKNIPRSCKTPPAP